MDQQRELRIDKAHEGWKTRYNEMIMTESKSIDDRLAMIEKKENNIMKQYEMNEEIMRNLKCSMNTELDVCFKYINSLIFFKPNSFKIDKKYLFT